jgi:hypothetical protein
MATTIMDIIDKYKYEYIADTTRSGKNVLVVDSIDKIFYVGQKIAYIGGSREEVEITEDIEHEVVESKIKKLLL